MPLKSPVAHEVLNNRWEIPHIMVDLNNSGFSEEQTSYLSGFVSGILQVRDLPFLGQDSQNRFTHQPAEAVETVHGTPVDELCREEQVKHEKHGLDCYDTIVANAESNSFPADGDIFRYKFHGLFFVSPAQESFMLRWPPRRIHQRHDLS